MDEEKTQKIESGGKAGGERVAKGTVKKKTCEARGNKDREKGVRIQKRMTDAREKKRERA